MRKIISLLLGLGMLTSFVACSKEKSSNSSSDENNSITSMEITRPKEIPENYKITTVTLPTVDTSAWITNTYELEGRKVTISVPPDIEVGKSENDENFLGFTIKENSELNKFYSPAPNSPYSEVGGFFFRDPDYEWDMNIKVDETHYQIPEVGFYLDFYYNENFEERTFHYFGDYLVFVPYPGGLVYLFYQNQK